MKKVAIIVSSLVVLVASIFFLRNISDHSLLASILYKEKALQHVTVGIQTSPAMALVMVAKDKGFFEKEGLNVELKEFTAGKFALEAFLAGSLDFSISGDVPAALAALQGHRFIIPAQVVRETHNEVRIVANKDGSLNTAKEYFQAKKRKLATSIGGGPEFFIYEFLKKIGIQKDQIEIISQKPSDMPAALTNGSVDAIAIFDPFAFFAEKQLGVNSITFTDRSVYSELYVLESRDDADSLEKAEKIIRGLVSAEKFIAENPREAKEIVAKYTKLDQETLISIWSSFDFRVALTPQLTAFLNREVDWAKATGKAKPETPRPDFDKVITTSILKKVKPSAIE